MSGDYGERLGKMLLPEGETRKDSSIGDLGHFQVVQVGHLGMKWV